MSCPLNDSDQGESRTPMPKSGATFSASCVCHSTTWSSKPVGNRSCSPSQIASALRPTDERAMQCVGQELNLHSIVRVGYNHLGSPLPSRRASYFLIPHSSSFIPQ